MRYKFPEPRKQRGKPAISVLVLTLDGTIYNEFSSKNETCRQMNISFKKLTILLANGEPYNGFIYKKIEN